MTDRQLKVLYCEVGKEPEERQIVSELWALQALVGGYIEHVRLFGNVCLICNEDGKRLQLAPNRNIGGETIIGNFFFTADGPDSEFRDLTPAETSKLLGLLKGTLLTLTEAEQVTGAKSSGRFPPG